MRSNLPLTDWPVALLDKARGLATIAEYLVLTQSGVLAEHPTLTVQRGPGTHGIRVWQAGTKHCHLQVDAHGTVLRYTPGDWEQQLVRLLHGPAKLTRGTLALLVGVEDVEAAERWAREVPAAQRNPLERLGAMALRVLEEV